MNTLTVSLVTIMIPGVIMALIYDTYTQHKSWDSFRYVLMSVVFGIVTYLAMQAAVSLFQLIAGIGDTKSINWRLLSVWSIPNEEKIAINPLEILLGGLCAIPLGLIAVYLATKRTFHELLLRKGISNKYGDDNAFIRSVEVMHRNTGQCYVLLHENNMLIHGTVFLYNENEKTQELGLLNATVLNSETGDALWMTNFIYLSKEYGKMVVFENYIEVPHMTKNQTPKTTSMPTFDGRQVRIQDGLQMATNGAQVISEGLQMVARPQQGNQLPGYGRQTSAQTTSQSAFAPVSGPKIPPMKK